ncbi:MAG: C40 family peptidase [Candidatus Marinimicrobia bacterium]|jgi:cell wall-associated NlpC family hydrolase|nr:C40 family peptidase [Candidatus Neomarinimicrobiota bacterium]MBT3501904.1 C40 family peptidase [Candidatus Neomarinimicrobiota bacterium]MBT3838570.1 C40 family peptidase [Candidatus Neomarinimicrobiota bacterium]MBT3999816.1 C40 family peptidase [Candidatus Neomarinimicrobiota bacterium]MBT4281871.1 C40 family peptidase [Candidatus Neomarinimicrobiota bacterium]
MFSPKKEWFIITSGAAPVYKEANFNSPCFTEAIYGESCQILDHYENWIQIKCEDNYKGWVNSFYGHKSSNKNNPTHKVVFPNKMRHFDSKFPFGAKVNDSIEGTIPIIEKIGFEQIIPIAKNLLGTPYKWGGKTSLGIDCSGLVQSVLKACGLDIPRDSYQQQEFFVDDEISMNQTGRGDLHFFGKNDIVTHVAFSTGGKKILHSQGKVKEESLDPNDENVNQKLIDMYLSSHSIQRKFHQ